MKSGHQIKVGIVVLLGLVTLAGIYWFFDRFQLYKSTYPVYAIFTDVQRLQNGADVRLAGVKIGRVENVNLTRDSRARVDLLIEKENSIPMDSTAKISTGAMIGEPYVEILPGKSAGMLKPGKQMNSLEAPTFDAMMGQVNTLVLKFQKTADAINGLLGNKAAFAQVQDIAKNLNKAIVGAADIMTSTQKLMDDTRPGIKATMANVEMATRNAAVMSEKLDKMLTEDAQPNIKAILAEAKKSAESLNTAMASANDLLSGFKQTSAKLDGVLTKADAAAEQATGMMTNLNKASESVKELATDQELKDNIRKTVRNAATVSDSAKGVVEKLNMVLNKGGPKIQPDKKVIPEYGTSIYALWNTRNSIMRVDTNYTFALNDQSFYRVGIYDIGANSKLTLMGGKVLDKHNSARYGILASELGAGYDYKAGTNSLFTIELFNPNDPTLELRNVTGIGHNLGVYIGASDLLHKSRRGLMLGVRSQR